MGKIISPLSQKQEIVSAYGFQTGSGRWEVYSDSETLCRTLALYHEIGINVVPVFDESMYQSDFSTCRIRMLSASCPEEDILDANHWLYERSEYKVDVTMFECLPEDVQHLLEPFLDQSEYPHIYPE